MKRTKAERLIEELRNKKSKPKGKGKVAPPKAKPKKKPKAKSKSKPKEKASADRDIQMERLIATRKTNPEKLERMFDKVNLRAVNTGKRPRREPTGTLIAAACNLIKSASVPVDVALRSLGVSVHIAQDWVRTGVSDLESGNHDTPCARLITALDIALAQDEVYLAKQIKDGFGRWQRVAYVIERRYGSRWGRDSGNQDAISLNLVQQAQPQAAITADNAGEVLAILEEHQMLVSPDANPGVEGVGIDLTSANGEAPVPPEEMQPPAFADPGQETAALVVMIPPKKEYASPTEAIREHIKREDLMKKMQEAAKQPETETEEQRRKRVQEQMRAKNEGFDW